MAGRVEAVGAWGGGSLSLGRYAWAIAILVSTIGAGCTDGDEGVEATPSTEATIPPALQDMNLIDFHSAFTETQNDLCVTCHGTMLDRQTLDPATPEFHRLKLDPQNGILPDWKCTDCHVRVDLVSRSGGGLRKQVDAKAICYPCHLPNGMGNKLYVK